MLITNKLLMPFQIRAKNLFLTYPQCPTDPFLMMERIQQAWDWKWIIVAQERHQDGNLHVHCAVALQELLSTRAADFADFIAGQHGNYQAMKNVKATIKYVTKDGSFIADGIDVAAATRGGRMSSPAGQIAAMVADGKTIEELHAEYPEYFVANLSRVQAYVAWRQVQSFRLREPRWSGCASVSASDSGLVEWLNSNICKERPFRQKQLWLHGPSGVGKTTLLDKLRSVLRVYELPKSEDFYDFYDNGCYDLIVCDEFKAHKTITFLNEFIQGTQMVIRKKGSQAIKSENLPVIICSNYTIRECYPKVAEVGLVALESRVYVHQALSQIQVELA